MRELVTMWRDARLVALTFVIAAVYAAALIPSSGLVLVEGFTTVRPANVLPVVFSLMFGPAAAWGSAFGNVLADAFSRTLTWGSLFGFVGNFLAGYVGYRLWGNLGRLSSGEQPTMRSGEQLLEYGVIALVSAVLTAAVIAWGLDLLGLFPFSVFATIVALNDFLAAVVLGPPLLYLLYPLARDNGLLYTDLLDEEALPDVPADRRRFAAVGLASVAGVWFATGLLASVFVQGVPFGAVPQDAFPPGSIGSPLQVALGTVAFALVLAFGFLSGDWLSAHHRSARMEVSDPGSDEEPKRRSGSSGG